MQISQWLKEKRILIKGLEANYKIAGQGQPFFILHGWGGSSGSWIEIQKRLTKEGFRVIVPDFPGFGKSLAPKEAWQVDNYVQWLKNFIEEMNIKEPFFLLSHSFGGRVAIKFAAKYPQKIKALILCSSAGIKSERDFKGKIFFALSRIGEYLFSQKFLRKFKDGARNIFYQIIRQRDYLRAKGAMRETVKKVLAEDLINYLSQIKNKTLIVWGNADRMVPIKFAYIMEEKIPNSKLIILPKIGHSPHLEVPEKLVEEILKFIKL
jgi:pimeloyl-ACP methyl ester carboxylesterase